ncbi:hypothetical protein OQA88_2303 [Cercophora sp. LCS_1]
MSRQQLLNSYRPPCLLSLPRSGHELDEVNALEEYSYEALPTPTSIRVLKLETLPPPPEQTSDSPAELGLSDALFTLAIPRCKMVIVDLEDNPNYDALSYTWGNPFSQTTPESELTAFDATRRYPVVCDCKRLMVTGNLYAFLNRIKRLGPDASGSGVTKIAGSLRSEYIWVDAIAINQSDNQEKSEQIQLMRRIYKQAHLVLVWLGPPDAHTEPSLMPLQWITQAPLDKAHLGEPYTLWDAEAYFKMGLPFISRAQWIALFALLDRTWFKRAWVVQEAVLASQMVFMVGLISLPWEALGLTAQWLHRSGFSAKLAAAPALRQVDEMAWILGLQFEYSTRNGFSYQEWRKGPRGGIRPWQESWVVPGGDIIRIAEAKAILGDEEELTLPWLLDYFRRTQATDARDKVYAFLGLRSLHDGINAPIIPDYNKVASHAYCEAAWASIGVTNDLSILSKVEDRSFRTTTELPSWVPDYSVANFPFSFLGEHAMQLFPNWFPAGKGQHTLRGHDSRVLTVNGYFLDEIAAVAESDYEKSCGKRSPQPNFIEAARIAVRTPTKYPHAHLETMVSTSLSPDDIQLIDIDISKSASRRGTHWSRGQRQTLRFLRESALEKGQRAQTRVEALWRTLICDTFGRTHPSTLLAGHAFARWLHMEYFYFVNKLEEEIRDPNQAVNDEPDASKPADQEPFYQAKYLMEVYSALAKEEPGSWLSMEELVALITEAREQHNLDVDEWGCPYSTDGIRFLPPDGALADPFIEWGKVDEKVVQDWVNQYQLVNYARRIFRTVENYLGNGPLSAQAGDQIWIIPGAAAPMILRPVGGDEFTLVGQAYVHGVMHGESIGKREGSGDGTHSLRAVKLV